MKIEQGIEMDQTGPVMDNQQNEWQGNDQNRNRPRPNPLTCFFRNLKN